MTWIRFIFYILARFLAKLTAPIAVFFVDRRFHPIWGVEDTNNLSWWNIAIRNGAHNCFLRNSPPHKCTGDAKMEESGLKRRFCRSLSGKYASFRVTWGKSRKKGKREFYIGWTLSQRRMRPVIQFRPF